MMLKSWILLSEVNPRFNLWEATCPETGEKYKECFGKGVDPNDIEKHNAEMVLNNPPKQVPTPFDSKTNEQKTYGKHLTETDFRYNAYSYLISESGMKPQDVAYELNMEYKVFAKCLRGGDYFRKEELKKLNNILGYDKIRTSDLRFKVNPGRWSKKCHGAFEESSHYHNKIKPLLDMVGDN